MLPGRGGGPARERGPRSRHCGSHGLTPRTKRATRLCAWTHLTWPDGSSASSPSTTSCSSRSRSVSRPSWPATRRHGCGRQNPQWLRLTKFFGKLFLINFALGVVTGIVQEFQFGMNWSAYSRFVGDIFGAPLAVEGLLAFFLESTFLGLWIFGWDRLSPKLHCATIWLAHLGTAVLGVLHPRGELVDAAPGGVHLQPADRPRRAALRSSPCCSTRSSWSRSRTSCCRRTSRAARSSSGCRCGA